MDEAYTGDPKIIASFSRNTTLFSKFHCNILFCIIIMLLYSVI